MTSVSFKSRFAKLRKISITVNITLSHHFSEFVPPELKLSMCWSLLFQTQVRPKPGPFIFRNGASISNRDNNLFVEVLLLLRLCQAR